MTIKEMTAKFDVTYFFCKEWEPSKKKKDIVWEIRSDLSERKAAWHAQDGRCFNCGNKVNLKDGKAVRYAGYQTSF